MIEVARIPILSDNYVWLLRDEASGEVAVVDPGEAAPVLAEADARGWRIGQIWVTHWHGDHTGGVAEIKAATGATVSGPAREIARVPTIDTPVDEGDRVRLGTAEGEVWAVPGHTAGHIAFVLRGEGMAFVGDTLFAMGCGRLFEGSAADMWPSMGRLAALPPETLVYCAHEYTDANGRYALVAEPDNQAIAARAETVAAARLLGEPTIPTTIGQERDTNPFLRGRTLEDFARLRAGKDAFKG